jgi:hypothetical protein
MKNKIVTVKDYFDGTKELNREEYIKTFQEHSLWLLKDFDDLDNTTKMYDDIHSSIDKLANLKFDLLYARQQRK